VSGLESARYVSTESEVKCSDWLWFAYPIVEIAVQLNLAQQLNVQDMHEVIKACSVTPF